MRKVLYIILVPLLAIEWLCVMIFNLWEVVTNSIKEITLSLEKYINSNAAAKPVKPGT